MDAINYTLQRIMQCKRCGSEASGIFCSNCGALLPPSISMPNMNVPPQANSSPDPRIGQQPSYTGYPPSQVSLGTPTSVQQPNWYADASLYGICMIIFSLIVWWYVSILFGILMAVIAIILGQVAIKQHGRIPHLILVFGGVALTIEIIIALILFGFADLL